MDIWTWILVGLVAGVLASFLIGGIGYSLLGDIIVGIVGSVIGSYIFMHWHLSCPIEGLAGTIFIAFIGASILLIILRSLKTITGAVR